MPKGHDHTAEYEAQKELEKNFIQGYNKMLLALRAAFIFETGKTILKNLQDEPSANTGSDTGT